MAIYEQEDEFLEDHVEPKLTNDYKAMMDQMIWEEESGKAEYVLYEDIRIRYSTK